MNEKEYNGWTNYETWAVKLWIDNEQGSQEGWCAQARECWKEAKADKICTREQRARYDLADALEYHYEDSTPEGVEGTVYGDLLGAALSEVNWDEIAQSLIDDAEVCTT